MKEQSTKKILNVGSMIFAILGIFLGILSILNIRIWLFRIFALGFCGMMSMFIGIREIAYENKKILGSISIVASITLLVLCFLQYMLHLR